jgi:hypothetical protein
MCGVGGRISDYTYAELSKMKLLGTEYTIPSFVDVLRLVGGRVPLLIELKGEDTSTELCKLIAPILDKYKGAYSVESFNPFLLRWFKKNRKSVARGQLVTKINAKKDKKNPILSFVPSGMLTNVFSRPDFMPGSGRRLLPERGRIRPTDARRPLRRDAPPARFAPDASRQFGERNRFGSRASAPFAPASRVRFNVANRSPSRR